MSASHNAMLRASCLLLLVAGSRQLSITEFAVPGAVEAGTNAELQCRYSITDAEKVQYVKWWWTPLYAKNEDKNPELIYQRMTGSTPDVLKKDLVAKNDDTIILMNLTPEDSGVYKCEVESSAAEVRKHQELIVYSNGTGIELNTTKVEDGSDEDDEPDVLVQCEAHEVSPLPELSLWVNGIEIGNLTQYVLGGSEDDSGLYDVFVNATVSSEEAEDAEILCELFFENKNVNHPRYMASVFYMSAPGARADAATEPIEDVTLASHAETASEFKPSGGVAHRTSWAVLAATILQLCFI